MIKSLNTIGALASKVRFDDSITDIAILNFLHDLDSPRSLSVWLLYSNKEYHQLVSLEINPMDYNDPSSFRSDYVATEFLSKASFLPLDVSKRVEAQRKFDEFESRCAVTNRRFKSLETNPHYNGLVASTLSSVGVKIQKILGDYSVEEHLDCCDWGPGVSTLLKGAHVSAANKFQFETGITYDTYSLFCPVLSMAYPAWMYNLHSKNGGVTFQKGNSICFVPKNAKTDRVIAIEPGLNLWLQKGLGVMIKRRLKRFGIDLNTQENNQRLAKLASHDGNLATIDFSSASDSISTEVVRSLLPFDWFRVLDNVRSRMRLNPDGSTQMWNKFSSMGNGFTFELESLIFYAVACCSSNSDDIKDISVFGDDVILPVSAMGTFSTVVEFLGFLVNRKKSFSSSAFRESCGSHYFAGEDVKPLYLKEKIKNVQAVYKLANSIRLYAHRRNHYFGCDAKFRRSVEYLVRRAPPALRLMVPVADSTESFHRNRLFGDCGFISNWDEAAPTYLKHGHQGYAFVSLNERGKESPFFDAPGLLFDRVRGSSLQTSGNHYTLRGRTRLCASRTRAFGWYNLGQWI